MRYVYGCQDPTHPRREVVHAMNDNPEVRCPICRTAMHRIPQRVRFYMNPTDVLLNEYDAKYRAFRARKAREQHA